MSEFEFNSKVAEKLKDVADIYYRPNTLFVSEMSRLRKVVNKINKDYYNLVLELHFNSFSDPRAHGVTALHNITNRYTKRLAGLYCDMVHDEFGIVKRDLIPVTSTRENGGTFILGCEASALLVEPFFGSNSQDACAFCGRIDDYANVLREFIKLAQ